MTSHQHKTQGRTFRIEVTLGAQTGEDPEGCLFVARIARLSHGCPRPVCDTHGKPEVYGPTEWWALRNALALLDSGAWRDAPQPDLTTA